MNGLKLSTLHTGRISLPPPIPHPPKILGIWCLTYGGAALDYYIIHCMLMGRDRVVGTATLYELEGPVLESQWGRGFSHPSRPVLGPTQSPIKTVPVFFPGGKAAGAWCWLPTPSSAEVKERIELHFFSPLGLRGLFEGEIYLYLLL